MTGLAQRIPRRIAVLSVHTSPIDQPGTGDGGGLNVYVQETSRRLAERGIHVDVFTRANDPDDPPVLELGERFAVHNVPAGPLEPVEKSALPSHLCAFLLALESHLASHGYDAAGEFDLVHAHYWLSGWVGRRLRSRWKVPLIQSFHTLGRVKNDALAPGDEPEPPIRLLAEDRLVREADRLVVSVCGEAAELHTMYGLSGSRLSVVPPGVDLSVFRPGPVETEIGAPPGDGPLLLFVGRLQPLKGPDLAVRTLAEVVDGIPDARLLIIGGSSGRARSTRPDALLRLAERLGVPDRVAVIPARPQAALADAYRAASVLLVPSRTESFGLVALEAQASGTPVVAADVGGLRSVVAGGALVPGHDPSDHAAAVVSLLSDANRREATRQLALDRAATLTWDATVDGLLDVYGAVTAPTRIPTAPAVRSVGA
jgi:D-inositol-3-phosphate glycosyltransferase